MSEAVTPYKDQQRSKKVQVAEMFDNIAPRYDFLNRFFTLGIDQKWRKKAIKALQPLAPDVVLDIATGTADFAIAALRLNPKIIYGVDISANMLAVGKVKAGKIKDGDKIQLSIGDSEALDFSDASIDAITVGFGVRNFEHLEVGLKEMHRVLRPGGQAVILEPAYPRSFPLKQLFYLYFKGILPLLGRLFSKDRRAYTYLPESVQAFPEGKEFIEICKKAGFTKAKHKKLSLGVCALYHLEK